MQNFRPGSTAAVILLKQALLPSGVILTSSRETPPHPSQVICYLQSNVLNSNNIFLIFNFAIFHEDIHIKDIFYKKPSTLSSSV